MDHPIILCVDDDESIRRAFARTMGRAGIEIELAQNGELALTAIEEKPDRYGVVFADYHMGPGMDGVTLLREVSILAPWATRILVSGQLDVPKMTRAVNSGAIFRVFEKPWEPRELLRTGLQGIARAQLSYRNAHLLGALKDDNKNLSKTITELEHLVIERTNDTLVALTEAIRLRNTEPHSRGPRLAAIVGRLAQELHLDKEVAADAEYAALLSGLGRIGLRDSTLHRRPPLPPEDVAALAGAMAVGADILDRVQFLRGAAEVLRGMTLAADPHRWPSAPIGARVLYAAQRLEALTQSGRRLSPATWPQIRSDLQQEAERGLDPAVLKALLNVPVDAWRALPPTDDQSSADLAKP